MLNILNRFPSELAIWSALASFSSVAGPLTPNKPTTIPDDILVMTGTVFSALWKYHWFCIINDKTWSHRAILQMFQQDHHTAINNFKST
ncbi:MAG: hypothetical protein JSY10_12170 [Paenibacillus sp.]|nr:hypothetical protein [Paenibacillus sp.]